MKRLLIACALVLSAVLPAAAQGTVMPIPLAQWFDNNGAVLTSGGLCVYRAGTSTLATTYTTAALTVTNANPILFSSGRASTGGVFLRPSNSYKFVLKDFTGVVTPTCIPDTGTTIWSVDNVVAQSVSASVLEIQDATAGESISAGDAVYISDGSGARTAGRWYKTDADFSYASINAYLIGIAEVAISSGDTGAVTLSGVADVAGPLSPGNRYWVSATAGQYTTSAPAFARQVGTGVSTTAIAVNSVDQQIPNFSVAGVGDAVALAATSQGRCTLTTGVPVTTTDVTAATTVYYSPYLGAGVGLYTGSAWLLHSFAEMSVAVPSTTSTPFDVFLDYNDGTPVLVALSWTNDTTRATALVKQDGIDVKTGDTQQRYLCTGRTTTVSGQTEDSAAKRYLWNKQNRVVRSLAGSLVTGTYNYTTDTYRQFNATATVQLDVMVGLAEEALEATVLQWAYNGGATVTVQISVGQDSTSSAVAGVLGGASQVGALQQLTATLRIIPALGRHFYAAIERSGPAGTTAWGPNANAMGAGNSAGITGMWRA